MPATGAGPRKRVDVREAERAPEGAGLSRRRFLVHSAAAVWSAPLIVSMMSRAASAATSGARVCGTKIDGPGTTDCRVTTPCGSASVVGCKGSPAAPAGSSCYCI